MINYQRTLHPVYALAKQSRWLLLACFILSGCQKPSTLEQIQHAGILHIITHNSPATYYLDHAGPTGFEFALASLFAQELGVQLRVTQANSVPELFAHLTPKQQRLTSAPHLAAAQLHITEPGQHPVRFGPEYEQHNLLLVYHRKTKKPKNLQGLKGTLQVMAGSSQAAQLKRLKPNASLNWVATTQFDNLDLLSQVNDGSLDYTIVDSSIWSMNALYFPNVRTAFTLPTPAKLAWAFPEGQDQSLTEAAQQFFSQIQSDGRLAQLQERFYGHLKQLDYVGAKTFLRQLNQRLPTYRPLFEEVANETGIDWRMLAAISYQESHWKPRATSPTGVRGMMMLTQITAKEMQIQNRLDPAQSIRGGAGYFQKIKQRIPQRITDPDRTWLALAAYNVGLGHLEDARKITERRGGNPDRWVDIKENLPLLTQRRWYEQTRYGYARGREPVLYVQNIRRYFNLLCWLTNPPHDALIIETKLTPEKMVSPPLVPVG